MHKPVPAYLLILSLALLSCGQKDAATFDFDGNVSMEYFIIGLSRYWRQYFPYKDSNGHRMLKLTCFSRPFAAWKNQEYWRLHGGIEVLELRINLTEGKLVDFYTGGYG
jgi:hypothetical protein